MRRAGVPGSQIAAIFGVTRHAVYRRLNKFPEYRELVAAEQAERRATEASIASNLEQGFSSHDVLELHGWDRAKFDSWKHRRGIYVPRYYPKFDVEKVWVEFDQQDKSVNELAKKYDVNRMYVRRALRRFSPKRYKEIVAQRKGGRKLGAKMGNSWDVDKAYNEFIAGDSVRTVARRYGKQHGTIRTAFDKRYGDEYRKLAEERLKAHRAGSGQRHAERMRKQRVKARRP